LHFSPIENVLAFSRSSALGAADIYFLRLDGRDPQRVTFDNLKVHGLAWAADGRRIIYSSNRGGNFNLWQIATTGGAPERVTLGGRSLEEPSISRSGNRLAYQDWSSDTNIWRLDLFRAGEAAPAAIITSTQWDWNPQFSPDGAHIAFVSDRSGGAEIWISDRDGTQPVQLTSFSGPYVNTPRWSPDSRYLVFNAPVDGNTELYIIGKNGGLPRRLTQSPGEKRAASWSRAGSWIYYSSNRSGDWQVWRMPVDGGEAMQITSRGGFASFESPDGKWLYFTKQAMPGLWRAPAGGGEEALVFAELHPVDWENWVVSAQGIYFVDRADPDRPQLAFFDLATGRSRIIAPLPRLLYKSGLTLSPDGRTLLYTQIDHNESDLMLVENWR
jgi:Tol biopolymer transport system component